MIIIAGQARSGLTATMQMLNAGGYPCVGEYPAFEKYGIGEVPWGLCKGMAVKLVDSQLQFPPKGKKYKVILLSRDFKQQALSMNKFLGAIMPGLPPIKVSALIRSLKRDYAIVHKWAKKQRWIPIRFEDIINDPSQAAGIIANFTDANLNTEKMADVIIKRTPECHPEILELSMIKGEI